MRYCRSRHRLRIIEGMDDIRNRIETLRSQLPADGSVRLVAVSKYAGLPQIIDAYRAYIRDFGESRIQDVNRKLEALPPDMAANIRWHFIGHLQSNKARFTLGNRFWLIHSVDSVALADRLSRMNVEAGTRQAVLLQVNLTEEPQKSGFLEQALVQEYPRLLTLPGLEIRGLMTIGPHTHDAAASRACFNRLHALRNRLVHDFGHPLPELSMGMSEDFNHAIECGATIIRIGNLIFAPSPTTLEHKG